MKEMKTPTLMKSGVSMHKNMDFYGAHANESNRKGAIYLQLLLQKAASLCIKPGDLPP
jgi:hypothetical protein